MKKKYEDEYSIDKAEIGRRIIELRSGGLGNIDEKISRPKLADKLDKIVHTDSEGKTVKYSLGRYERGEKAPPLKTVKLIAQVLNADYRYIIGESDSWEKPSIYEEWLNRSFFTDQYNKSVKTIINTKLEPLISAFCYFGYHASVTDYPKLESEFIDSSTKKQEDRRILAETELLIYPFSNPDMIGFFTLEDVLRIKEKIGDLIELEVYKYYSTAMKYIKEKTAKEDAQSPDEQG